MSLIGDVGSDTWAIEQALEVVARAWPQFVIDPEVPRATKPLGEYRARDMSPVKDRIERQLRALTEDELRQGVELERLRLRLAGFFGRYASAPQVAAGLRALGFVRHRSWRPASDGGFRSRWYRPQDVPQRRSRPHKPKACAR